MISFIRQPWVRHVAIWATLLALIIWGGSAFRSVEVAIVRGAVFVGMAIMLFYANSGFFMPRLFERKKYGLYALVIIGSLMLFSASVHLLSNIEWLHDMPDRPGMRPNFRDFPFMGRPRPRTVFRLMPFIGGAIPGVVVLFISTISRLMVERQKREQRELAAKNQHLEAEMQFLRSQINPHFLFNALNNIYSLTQTKSDKAPEMVLKLSEMLRYVLYESNVKEVPLSKEVQYIRNFIGLQLLKDDRITNVSFDADRASPNEVVAPMLLLPFVENAFKHSKIEDTENGWIKVELTAADGRVNFRCDNSSPATGHTTDDTGGVGLKNVRRRLELLYPGRNKLIAEPQGDTFTVRLTLET